MSGYYYNNASELNREVRKQLDPQLRKALHKKSAFLHFLVVGQQFLLLVGLALALRYVKSWWMALPVSILLGFVVFSFSVLLHEVVHKVVFERDRPRTYRLLGFLYGAISGLSASQFHKWHMDHHNELGDAQADPKRFYLSPKRNQRWYKLLYATPFLFFIYFRAAAKAAKSYPQDLRTRIKKERLAVISGHLAVLAAFWVTDPIWALKAYIIPVFLVFPIAFTLNRLGQHYVIDPNRIEAWSTLMRPNLAWNFLYLWSSYHLEHHYLPGVPMYRLGQAHRALRPFYQKHDLKVYGYLSLLKLWLVNNHRPHTKPSLP